MEIRTDSSDSNSSRQESSSFDRVQRRSNESRDGKKKGSDVKLELEGKGLSFKNDQGYKRSRESGSNGPERKSRKGSISKRNKKTLSSNDSNVLPICSKKRRTQDKVAASTNRHNL
ncbi:uncharacterized protein TNCV_3686731 [Trichonephila clavipes]|nr:uncharacterized protein TNCV_3686731 [Trichonephila clavipes]